MHPAKRYIELRGELRGKRNLTGEEKTALAEVLKKDRLAKLLKRRGEDIHGNRTLPID